MENSFGQTPDPNVITQDERTLSLFSHLSLFLGGIVLPIIFWATNKDKSKFVTFHALQAVWFHVAYIVGIVIVAMFAAIGGMGMAALFGGMSTKGHSNDGSPILVIMMIVIYAAIFLVIFAGIGYAIYMGVKSYHGKFVKYPIIGNIIYKKVYGESK